MESCFLDYSWSYNPCICACVFEEIGTYSSLYWLDLVGKAIHKWTCPEILGRPSGCICRWACCWCSWVGGSGAWVRKWAVLCVQRDKPSFWVHVDGPGTWVCCSRPGTWICVDHGSQGQPGPGHNWDGLVSWSAETHPVVGQAGNLGSWGWPGPGMSLELGAMGVDL